MFRQKSRSQPGSQSSSRYQSNENLGIDIEETESGTVNYDFTAVSDMEDDIKLRVSSKRDPLEKIILQLTEKLNSIAPKKDRICIKGICRSLDEKTTLDDEKTQLNIKNQAKEIKTNLLDSELRYHLIEPGINFPRSFSENPTLTTISRNLDCARMFPRERGRFSGSTTDQSPPLNEFIFALNIAQSKMNLSREEFAERLVLSCTKDAHIFVKNLIDEQTSIEDIFFKLKVRFDRTPSVAEIRQRLLNYRVKRSENFAMAQAYVLSQAQLLAANCADPTERRLRSDYEAKNALSRSLPVYSQTLLENKFSELTARRQAVPTFNDFVSYLYAQTNIIDADIKSNGAIGSYDKKNNQKVPFTYRNKNYSANSMTARPGERGFFKDEFNENFPKNNSKRTFNENKSSTHPKGNHRSPNNYYVNALEVKSNQSNNNFMNKQYCSLCGLRSHTPLMGCYSMRQNGRTVPNVMPVQEACKHCLKIKGIRLFHPEKFCFTKNKTTNRRD